MDWPESSKRAEEINQIEEQDEHTNDLDPSLDMEDELDLTTQELENRTSRSSALNELPEASSLDHQDQNLSDDVMKSCTLSPDLEPQSPDLAPQSPDLEPQSPDLEPQSPDREPQSPDFEPHSPDLEPQSPDFEPHSPDHEPQSPDFEPQSPNLEPQSHDMTPSSQNMESIAEQNILSAEEALGNTNLNAANAEKCGSDQSDSEGQDDTETGATAEESVTNYNSTKTQDKTFSEHTDKTSENDSDSESLNSSLVSQRTLENLSENMSDTQRLALPRYDGDFEKDGESVGGSSRAEDERHVVGLEELENLATENGRCGSSSIVSEATDTLAGSLVVETGSVGGESGTVRSMPQSEVSDYDYQDVENGEEGEVSDDGEGRIPENTIQDNVSEREETASDVEAQENEPSSAKPQHSENVEDGKKHTSKTLTRVEKNQKPDSDVYQADSLTSRDVNSPSGQPAESESDGEVDKSDSEANGSESGDVPADEDFDYDDLDLETVSETEPLKNQSSLTESSEAADGSLLLKDSDNQQQSKTLGHKARHDHQRSQFTQNTATNSSKIHLETGGSLSTGIKSRRSPKPNLAEDHVELDYDEEDIVEEKGRHVELVDDELENGELPDDDDEVEAGEKSDEGELDDDDDCEEGEIREPGNRKPFVKPICRFYLNGKCTWGNNCRFLHPGVNDKGNYRLIERPGFNNTGPGMRGPMGPGNWGHGERGPETEFIAPLPEPQPTESAWERGLRHAKELMKKATHRKETDPGFEEKRLNLSVEEEREFNKENDQRRLGDKDPYIDPHIDDDFYEKPTIAWQQGQYENFEVRWNAREPDYTPYRERQTEKERGFVDRRGPSAFSHQPHSHGPSMHPAERFNKRRDDRREKWRETGEEPFVPSSGGPPRERADVWHDPWRRSKSPKRKLRESPSRSRSRGRRRYRRSYSYSSSYSSSSLSGSSRSRSRSSYSSFSSRSSISRSSFSSRSATRSEDLSRRRPLPSPASAAGPPHTGGPPQVQGAVVGAKTGAFIPGAGPAGDRKQQQPANKPGEPRSAVAVKQRQPRPGQEKRRPVIGPMPRQPVRDRPPPPMNEGRGRGMRDRGDRGRGRGQGTPNENPLPGPPVGKRRGTSMSSSGSSQSRSRSRSSSSTSRSRSVSSVSSISSSSSSSSSGSADSEHLYRDIAEPDLQDKDRPPPPGQGRGKRKTVGSNKGAGSRAEHPDRGHKDRPRDKRPRYSSPSTLGGSGRGARPENRHNPTDASGKPQVSSTTTTTTTKSKDPMKSVGQKSNIKLTLISKPSEKNGMAGKKRPAEGSSSIPPPAKKPPVSPTKQLADKGGKAIGKGDKPAPVPSLRMKPPQAVGRLNPANPVTRPLTSPAKAVAKLPSTAATAAASAAAAAAAAKAAKKSTSSRREELLKQLKAVEDAIARKRSKLP